MIELSTYAERLKIPVERITGRSRKREPVYARYVYFLYMRNLGYTYVEIAEKFDKTHASVIFGVKTVNELIEVNDKYLERFLKAIDYEQ